MSHCTPLWRIVRTCIIVTLAACAVPLPALGACRVEPVPAGTRIDVTRGIAGIPGRQIQTISPGQTGRFEARFQNRTGSDSTMEFVVRDVAGTDSVAQQPIKIVERGAFGAASWISISCKRVVLKHGETAVVDVIARAPQGQDPGSYYAAVVGSLADTGRASASSTSVTSAIGVQVFFDIPGVRSYAGRIVNSTAPRVLVRHWKPHVEAVSAAYRNDGSVTDTVSGQVVITSFTDRRVASLNMDQAMVLRGGIRKFSGQWKNAPWFGRFEPAIELTRSDGSIVRRRLDPIWVIPAWPYWLLFVAAISLPFLWRMWDRRRIERLLEAHEDARWDDDEQE